MPVSRLRFNPSTGKWEEAAADDGAVRPEVPLTGASANDGTQLGLDPTKTYGATDIAGAAAANRVLTGQFGLTAQEQQNISDEAVRRLKQTTAPLYEGLTQNAIARGVFRGGPLTSAYGTVATDFAEQVGATERGIASDAALRAAQERETAISTLANIGNQQDTLGLAERQQTEVERATEEAEKALGRQLTEAERSALVKERLQQGELTGYIPGEMNMTSAAVASKLGIDPSLPLTLVKEQAKAAGYTYNERTGLFASPSSSTIAGRSQEEAARATRAQEYIQRAEQMGFAAPESGLDKAEILSRLGLSATDATADAKIQDAGYTLGADGKYSTKGAATLAGRQFGLQEKATVAQFTGKFGEDDTLEKVAQDAKLALDAALMTGELVIRDAEGNPVLDKATGKPLTLLTMASKELVLKRAELTGKTAEGDDTMASKELALKRAELTGKTAEGDDTMASKELALKRAELTGKTAEDDETMDQKRLNLEAEIQRGQIALQQDAQNFGQKITEADLTGYYKRFGMADWADFQASYGSALGSPGYNGKFDLNDDKKIDFEDFTDFAAIVNGQAAQTLKGQAFAEDVARNDFQEAVTKAGLTGTIDGQRTVQELQRTFDNGLKEAELFGGTPPITLTKADLDGAIGSKKGDANYRAEFDVNKDGQVDFANDFIHIAQRIRDEGGGVYVYQPEGPQTLQAKALGLEEKRYTEGVREFDKNFGEQVRQFGSSFTGYLFDEDGNITTDKDGNPVSTQAREQWDSQVKQLEDMFSGPQEVYTMVTPGGARATGTRQEMIDKGVFDAGGNPKAGWNFDANYPTQTLTPIERLVTAVGGDPKGTMRLGSEQQLALVQSVMSVLFQPVQASYAPQNVSPWTAIMGGLGSGIGAFAAAKI